ncbi:MAG: molybdopterin-guanine dinucleotide biosynthesis protein B [Lachnospiraceae bacterium]|nr:molybdopterin-guanine dinucleotide biosynthesis protein B [Lachnospiraceae bacterium]
MKNAIRRLSVGILAGGESSRMGQDKALIRLGNERIIDRISGELKGFSEVIVSAAKPGVYEELGFPVVYDENRGIGPIEGIRQVLAAAKEEYVFICAADMPFIKKELVSYISGYISSGYDCYVIADEDHIQPLCAIYSGAVLPVIEELIRDGKYRLREIFSRVRTKYITLEHSCFDKKTIRNINTREDLFEAGKPFVFCVSGLSDSGKTGLIVKLINEFIACGMSVGVIKHDGHDVFSDKPGSDSERFYKAGASCTAVFSDKRSMRFYSESTDERELIDKMRMMKAPPDVIIIEGLKASMYPKVEVIRRRISEKSQCAPETLICIATDCISPESVNCPVFGLEDVKGIFSCIMEHFGIPAGSGHKAAETGGSRESST